MKGRFSNYLYFFIFAILFFILERGEMFRRFGDEEVSFAALNYIILAMIALSALFIFNHKKYIKRSRLQNRFLKAMIVIYSLTVLWSAFIPLSSRNIYGYYLLPIFIFLFINVYIRVNDAIDITIYSMYIVGVLLIIYYFVNYTSNVFYDVELQSNTSYTVLYYLPMMLCIPQKWLRYVAMVLVSLAVMFSLKRGGFIAVLLGLLAYFYIIQIKMKKNTKKLWGLVLFVCVSFIAYYVIIRVNGEVLGDMLFDRMSMINERGGSGRMEIYMNTINNIVSSNPENILFGHGWCETRSTNFSRLTAHNDFLEIFYDFGIVAFILYIMVIVELFKLEKVLIRNNSEFAPALGASIAIFLTNSMVSHIWIYCQYLLIFAFFWGFVLATENRRINENRNINLSRGL